MADERFIVTGTTVCTARTTLGALVGFDSLSNIILSKEEMEAKKPSQTDEVKAIKIGDDIIATVAGNSGWYTPIVNDLIEMLERRGLTAEQCARYASNVFKDEDYGIPAHWTHRDLFDIQKQPCSITFSSYNQGCNVPLRVINVARDSQRNVTYKNLLTLSEVENLANLGKKLKTPPFITFCCQGTGGRFADRVLRYKREIFEEGTDQEQQVLDMSRAMAWACVMDPQNTGGIIRVILLTQNGVKLLFEEKAENLVKKQRNWLDGWERLIED